MRLRTGPRAAALALLALSCGGGGSTTSPSTTGSTSTTTTTLAPALGALPVALSPASNETVAVDNPTFRVQNAQGYDGATARYTFEVQSRSGRVLSSVTVNGGSGTTLATFPTPVPRGMALQWRVVAQNAAGTQVTSGAVAFRGPAVDCPRGVTDLYAKSVIDSKLPFCDESPNAFNDPNEALGPPNVGGFGPFNWTGFVSLGEGGYISLDMGTCATNGAGNDLRVFQAVGSEPVSVYVSGNRNGPWVELGYRVTCGTRWPGFAGNLRYCEFDLGAGEVETARYVRVEDGELFPCRLAETPSEGADIDAVEILNQATAAASPALR